MPLSRWTSQVPRRHGFSMVLRFSSWHFGFWLGFDRVNDGNSMTCLQRCRWYVHGLSNAIPRWRTNSLNRCFWHGMLLLRICPVCPLRLVFQRYIDWPTISAIYQCGDEWTRPSRSAPECSNRPEIFQRMGFHHFVCLFLSDVQPQGMCNHIVSPLDVGSHLPTKDFATADALNNRLGLWQRKIIMWNAIACVVLWLVSCFTYIFPCVPFNVRFKVIPEPQCKCISRIWGGQSLQ